MHATVGRWLADKSGLQGAALSAATLQWLTDGLRGLAMAVLEFKGMARTLLIRDRSVPIVPSLLRRLYATYRFAHKRHPRTVQFDATGMIP